MGAGSGPLEYAPLTADGLAAAAAEQLSPEGAAGAFEACWLKLQCG